MSESGGSQDADHFGCANVLLPTALANVFLGAAPQRWGLIARA